MGAGDSGRFWSAFDRDPRQPDNQALRAGDRDRDVVRDAVSEAYADGRLTRDEMDGRLTQVLEAKVLGDLLPVVADLVPTRDTGSRSSLAYAGPDEIDRQAVARYAEQRRRALGGMLVPSLICLTIWVWSMVSSGGPVFPWPLFVILGTGGYLFRLLVGRESAIEEERERLRKKQAKAITAQPEGADDPEDPDQERRPGH